MGSKPPDLPFKTNNESKVYDPNDGLWAVLFFLTWEKMRSQTALQRGIVKIDNITLDSFENMFSPTLCLSSPSKIQARYNNQIHNKNILQPKIYFRGKWKIVQDYLKSYNRKRHQKLAHCTSKSYKYRHLTPSINK